MVDFRVKVVNAETVDDGGGCFCEEGKSTADRDGPERSEEENSPSVVDELVPDPI